MRSSFARPFLAAAALAVSVAALYGFLVLPLPKWRVAVLLLLVIGVVASLANGWLLGRFLWNAVKRGGPRQVILPIQALVGGSAVFCFLSSYGGYPVVRSSLFEALVAGVFLAAVMANSYAVGWASLSGGAGPTARGPVVASVVLYGSILIGFILLHVVPAPWGKVAPYPGEPPEVLSFAEYIADARTRFPFEHEVETDRHGALRIRYKGPRDKLLRECPFVEASDDVMAAEGSCAVLREGTVEVLGVEMYCHEPVFMHPDGTIRHIEEEEEADRDEDLFYGDRIRDFTRVGYWRLDGTSVPEAEWPHELNTSGVGIEVIGWFHLQNQGDIYLYNGPENTHQLVLVPWEVPIAQSVHASTQFWFGLPVPGPLELRVAFVRSEEREHRFPAEEGAVAHLERDSLQVVKLLGGGYQTKYLQGDWTLRLSLDGDEENNDRTTVVLCSLMKPYGGYFNIDIRALTVDGEELPPLGLQYGKHFIWSEFDCPPGTLTELIVHERPHVTQIRFPVSDIPFFPRENYSLDNLVELRVPYMLRNAGYIRRLFLPALQSRYEHRSDHFRREVPPMASMREILNAYYPSAWRVEHGVIRLRSHENLKRRVIEVWRYWKHRLAP